MAEVRFIRFCWNKFSVVSTVVKSLHYWSWTDTWTGKSGLSNGISWYIKIWFMEESCSNRVCTYAGEGRSRAWSPCFPTSRYSFRDDCVVLGCTRPIRNEYLTIWKTQIFFFSLTATAQDVQLTKLEWWMVISDWTDMLQPWAKHVIHGVVGGGIWRSPFRPLAFYSGFFPDTVWVCRNTSCVMLLLYRDMKDWQAEGATSTICT
jgi:hypothetical protein